MVVVVGDVSTSGKEISTQGKVRVNVSTKSYVERWKNMEDTFTLVQYERNLMFPLVISTR